MKKAVLITNIPNPYRIPLFNRLGKSLREDNIKLYVLFGSEISTRRKFKINMEDAEFTYKILSTLNIRYKDKEKTSYTYGNLYKTLGEINPDVVIVNGYSVAAVKIWLRSYINPTPYITWSGAIMHKTVRIGVVRSVLRKLIVRRSAAYIAYGSMARDYLVALGADRERVHVGINTVDVGFFMEEVKKYRGHNYRAENNILCVSYLTPRKSVDQVIKAIQLLSGFRSDFFLDIVGDGPEIHRLRELARQYGVESYIRFHGFVQKSELPEYYGKSICFLFPTSYDIWGLTLVEAMASGLLCIASRNAGATYDLVQQGITGFSADYDKPEEICKLIEWVLDNKKEAMKIADNASDYIMKNITLEKSANGFHEAIASVVKQESKDLESNT